MHPKPRPRFASRPTVKHPQSSKNGYIIFLGSHKSGKSKTIDFIFGNRNITEAGESPLVKTEPQVGISEYSTHLNSGHNVKIIDVPGFTGDATQIKTDARIIASLKKFMDTDPELKSCIPHVIVITGKFHDPELTYPTSPFVRTLKAVDLLNQRLLDKSSCNVIILLTHFMSGREEYREDPNLRYDEVIDAVRQNTNFPQMPYILIGENFPEAWNLSRYDNKNCYVMPHTNEIYPSNVIEHILKISAGGTKSSLGPEFFKEVFKARQKIFLWRSVFMPLVKKNGSRCRKVVPMLKATYERNGQEKSQIPSQPKKAPRQSEKKSGEHFAFTQTVYV